MSSCNFAEKIRQSFTNTRQAITFHPRGGGSITFHESVAGLAQVINQEAGLLICVHMPVVVSHFKPLIKIRQ
jgi:hypothetical protein